jgi:hypothetical protein
VEFELNATKIEQVKRRLDTSMDSKMVSKDQAYVEFPRQKFFQTIVQKVIARALRNFILKKNDIEMF